MTSREKNKQFRSELNSMGKQGQGQFKKLCRDGCNAEKLTSLLLAACTSARANRGQLKLFGNLDKGRVKKLSRDLQSLAAAVERLNESPLSLHADLLASVASGAYAVKENHPQ